MHCRYWAECCSGQNVDAQKYTNLLNHINYVCMFIYIYIYNTYNSNIHIYIYIKCLCALGIDPSYLKWQI